MAHRSNQAVASQDRAAGPVPDAAPTPPKRPLLVGWLATLLALAASVAALALALWLFRMPLAAFVIKGALAERGAEADFKVARLDFGGAELTGVRFGSETEPDAAIGTVTLRWAWRGLSPQLRALTLIEPRLRLRMDQGGRISAGSLDGLRSPPTGKRPTLPAIDLDVRDGQGLILAPFGALPLTFEGSGVLGTDFAGHAQIRPTTLRTEGYALENGAGELVIISHDGSLAFRLTLSADAVTWADARIARGQFSALGRAPLDLARYDVETSLRAGSLVAPRFGADAFAAAFGIEALTRADSLDPAAFEGEAHATAGRFGFGGATLFSASFDSHFSGQDAQGRGEWTLGGERFTGLSMLSADPRANGAFRFDLTGDEELNGEAHVVLAQSALNAQAQQHIRDAFPNIISAPVGPTFAQAERALDAAADRFVLTIPLTLHIDEHVARVAITAPIEARAASRTALTLAPLRNDAPALILQWPGPTLHGAVALELQGGGAPNASMLLDTVDWATNAAFEADGTLSIDQWRANGAEIAANELGVHINIAPRGGGQLDLDGPARITGPLGDGEVRDLVADLDLAIAWGAGWRVTPNHGCLPVRLGRLDAAGLSFASGAFSLCPLAATLIAADVNRRLSGGFLIQRLGLNGHMSGPDRQPARLSASAVSGIFSGTTDNVLLAVDASTPALAIDMAEGRTLTIAGQHLTANARIDESWSVEGAFETGVLTDPSLPGSVSAIVGRWTAAPDPDDNGAVIAVSAGEAALTANRPKSEDERPLFNPMRLANVNGQLRNGRIDAQGELLLADRGRQLATWIATHEVSQGVGSARVTAADIVFDPRLQPYEISEIARGMVENVRGHASGEADIIWTRDSIHSSGVIRPLGLSLALQTIPVIQDVRGEVRFDDLFAMTTPPGQQVTIGLVNPGIEVHNGRLQFQLLPEQRIAIERAEFEFASGTLAVAPTTITMGADETRFELTLHGVDAAALVSQLNVPDLSATGQLEGSFPLRLTPQSAFVENGVLRATAGGAIAYTGNAGQATEGASRVAFDALRNFRYDNLQLSLNGDLNGEVISSITFQGHNSGKPVDVTPIAQIPGVGRVTAHGVPFDFNVSITAPFRRLADTAATIVDPSQILDRAQQQQQEQQNRPPQPNEPVDQTPPGTR